MTKRRSLGSLVALNQYLCVLVPEGKLYHLWQLAF